MKLKNIIPWLVSIFILSLPIWLTPNPIQFKPVTSGEAFQLLGNVALIALFLERVLEVFITTWRGPGYTLIDTQTQALENKLAELKESKKAEAQDQIGEAENALEKANFEKVNYKSETQRLALWSGFALGLLISAIGIRILNYLVEPASLQEASQYQKFAFLIIDVFITGGLIAGGSDGIHKLFNVYDSLMESTRKRIKTSSG